MREDIQKAAEDIAYRMYENSGKSKYIRTEWANKPYHPDDAAKDIMALITVSNKALLRRVRERGPKDPRFYFSPNDYKRGQIDTNALWNQALNEEEAKL